MSVSEEPASPAESVTSAAAAWTDDAGPVMWPEVQVSRQYAFHVLKLPGQTEPTWHRWLFQALARLEHAGYDSLTIVIGDAHYRLSQHEGDP